MLQTPPPSQHSAANSFHEAKSHSRRVRQMRIVLPILGVLGLLTFLGVSFLTKIDGPMGGISGISIDSSGITMEKPFLSGHSKSGRKYEVTALTARQELGKSKQIVLDNIVASLELPNNGWAKITAATGLYDGEKETLTLQNDIHVISHLGYTLNLKHAYIELHDGIIRSDEPVDVLTDNKDSVRSDSMFITKGGESMQFKGRVHMQIQSQPSQQDAQK